MAGCVDRDDEGRLLLTSGTWNGDASLSLMGGQGMHFVITNINVVGTTITIESSDGSQDSALILPQTSADLKFARFGQEPLSWDFHVSSDSDAFIVNWCLYSTWVTSPPSIESVSPAEGSSEGGTTVTIAGAGLKGATDVGFGGTNVASLRIDSDSQLTVTSPAGTGTVDVVVITPYGTSPVVPADQFTYRPPSLARRRHRKSSHNSIRSRG